MASTSDPLLAMRDAIKMKTAITYLTDDVPTPLLQSASHVSIPVPGTEPLVLAKTTPSRFRKPSSSTEFYAVGAVLACWLFRDAGAAEYMRACREAGYAVGFVSVTERKGVVDWLEGRRGSHDRLAKLPDAADSTPQDSPKPAPAPGVVTGIDTPAAPAKRRYEPDKADIEAVKRIRQSEVELRDRSTVLRGVKVNNFTSFKNVMSEKLKKLKESSKPGQPQLRSDAAASKPDPKMANKKRANYPIIMISSSPTSLITMHNVKKFLEESAYMTPEQAREQEGGAKPEDVIAIYRQKTHIGPGGKQTQSRMKYFVVDSVEALAKFGADPWDRVICVMTTGQAWQFRPYKWSEPLQLFHNVKGIYVAWANDPPNPKIKDWNVTDLRIDQYRRHVDKSVVASFWMTLDSWVATNKPSLSMT